VVHVQLSTALAMVDRLQKELEVRQMAVVVVMVLTGDDHHDGVLVVITMIITVLMAINGEVA
jgi:hypothetical protein